MSIIVPLSPDTFTTYKIQPFPLPLDSSISCGGNHSGLVVGAAFPLPCSCRLDSKLIIIRSSHRFLFVYTPTSLRLSPVSLDLPVSNIMNITMLPSYNDNLPDPFDFIPSSHVTFGFPVLPNFFVHTWHTNHLPVPGARVPPAPSRISLFPCYLLATRTKPSTQHNGACDIPPCDVALFTQMHPLTLFLIPSTVQHLYKEGSPEIDGQPTSTCPGRTSVHQLYLSR